MHYSSSLTKLADAEVKSDFALVTLTYFSWLVDNLENYAKVGDLTFAGQLNFTKQYFKFVRRGHFGTGNGDDIKAIFKPYQSWRTDKCKKGLLN